VSYFGLKCLIIIYYFGRPVIKHFKPFYKFLAIKLLILLFWAQDFIIGIFVLILTDLNLSRFLDYLYLGNDYSACLSNSLLILECLPFTVLLGYAFSPKEANVQPITYNAEDEWKEENLEKEVRELTIIEEDLNIAKDEEVEGKHNFEKNTSIQNNDDVEEKNDIKVVKEKVEFRQKVKEVFNFLF